MNNLFSTMNNPLGGMQGMLAQVQQLKKQFNNRNPQDIINEMLQSGQINQTQVDQAKQMAQQLRSVLR